MQDIYLPLLCIDCQRVTMHVQFAENGELFTTCQECEHTAYDGPDSEAVSVLDLSTADSIHDEWSDAPLEPEDLSDGLQHHIEPPC